MFAVILNPSSGLDLVLALELWLAEDVTAEIVIPTCVVPTDGANWRGSTPANPMVRDPGLVMRGTSWTIARRLTGGYVPARYYCVGRCVYREAKAGAHKARVTDGIGRSRRPPPSPYILG